MSNKFANITAEIGGKVFEVRCTGAALAAIEDLYSLPFTEAVVSLVGSLDRREFKLKRLVEVFHSMIVGDKPTVVWLLEHIESTAETIKIVEAVGRAIVDHFPNIVSDKQVEAGDEAAPDPTPAASR